MRWLLDEMLPPDAAVELERLGHEAWSVHTIGLVTTPDADILGHAVEGSMVMVTENRGDFAGLLHARLERGDRATAVLFVRRSTLPRGGALAHHLAVRLDRWAAKHPDPSPVLYWLPADG